MSNTEDRAEMKVYEVGYLVLPSLPEEKVSEVVDSIKKIVSEKGGSEIDSEDPFKKNLAYSMSKTVGASKYVVNEAYIGWLKFEVETDKIEEIKKSIEDLNEVLRFILVKAEKETHFTFASVRKEEEVFEEAEESEESDDSEESEDTDESDDENVVE